MSAGDPENFRPFSTPYQYETTAPVVTQRTWLNGVGWVPAFPMPRFHLEVDAIIRAQALEQAAHLADEMGAPHVAAAIRRAKP